MKSEKAKQRLYESFTFNSNIGIDRKADIEAVELAEQEAEERMRRKAVEAFDDMWINGGEPDYEYQRKRFIRKLTKK